MATKVAEWPCSHEEVRRIVAELRPLIDRMVDMSYRQLACWADEQRDVLASV